MRINHNISAQLANVNLKRADRRMSASLERLSSGYKINKAADDSAGIAITNKMRAQIRALDQASRNADDGQSIIQTAEGSLSEIEALIQRMRELAVQAASDTCTIEDREAVQVEIDKLLDEVDRIAETTEFNGNGLLDGSCARVVTFDKVGLSSLAISEDVKAGDYKVTVDALAEPAIGNVTYAIPATGKTTIEINGVTISIASTDTFADVDSRITEVCDKMGIDVEGGTGALILTTRANGLSQSIAVKLAGQNTATVTQGTDAEITLGAGFTTNAKVTSDGNNITITDQSGFKMQIAVEGDSKNPDQNANPGDEVTVSVYDTGSMMIQIGANEHQDMSIDFPEVSCRTLQFKEGDGDSLINVCSQKGASKAISTFDDAIRSVSSFRSRLGAYANRLESTVSSLDVTSENMTDSMSQIMDTDMAASMTDYTQESVLSQAATAILAQANNRPQQIMSLLQS